MNWSLFSVWVLMDLCFVVAVRDCPVLLVCLSDQNV
jgi:hypothetical protein